MTRNALLSVCAILLLALPACKEEKKPDEAAAQKATNAESSMDANAGEHSQKSGWEGRWTGPEGTYLQISKQGDGYKIENRTLDASEYYQGVFKDGKIIFQRGGRQETLTKVDGRLTGMKWLADKHDCLAIKPGEGFCRD